MSRAQEAKPSTPDGVEYRNEGNETLTDGLSICYWWYPTVSHLKWLLRLVISNIAVVVLLYILLFCFLLFCGKLSALNVRDEVILISSIVIIFHIVCLCLSFSLSPSGFLRWEQLRSEWLKPVAGQTARKRKSKYDIVWDEIMLCYRVNDTVTLRYFSHLFLQGYSLLFFHLFVLLFFIYLALRLFTTWCIYSICIHCSSYDNFQFHFIYPQCNVIYRNLIEANIIFTRWDTSEVYRPRGSDREDLLTDWQWHSSWIHPTTSSSGYPHRLLGSRWVVRLEKIYSKRMVSENCFLN